MERNFDMYLYGPRSEGENYNIQVTENYEGDRYHVVIFESKDGYYPPSEHFDTKGFDDEESLFAFLKDMTKGIW
tara:strand:- start:404 stop:625 length:222 start_codon:yes stop_codon:yes gene_type:complete